MGYHTDFNGQFELEFKDLGVQGEVTTLVNGLADTRRVARDNSKLPEGDWGIEGEFYIVDDNLGVVDSSQPPRTQPELYLQWVIEERKGNFFLEWNGGEKFYEYIPWLEYLINSIFIPNKVILNGEVTWQGEDCSDIGLIQIKNNKINIKSGSISYGD